MVHNIFTLVDSSSGKNVKLVMFSIHTVYIPPVLYVLRAIIKFVFITVVLK